MKTVAADALVGEIILGNYLQSPDSIFTIFLRQVASLSALTGREISRIRD